MRQQFPLSQFLTDLLTDLLAARLTALFGLDFKVGHKPSLDHVALLL